MLKTGDEWTLLFEIETLRGLEEFAASELKQTIGIKMARNRVDYRGRLAPLLSLRTAVAVHRYERFEGSRPTVILGDQRLREMLKFVTSADKFTGFRISSPGKDSAALRRVRDSVAASTGLPEHPEGDLLVRIRRDHTGWEVLVRVTARSLSTRPWRVADMPGALHATMAAVMVDLTAPRRTDRILNLCCGSGTLLAETRHGKHLIGVDNADPALQAARANLAAANRTRKDTVPTSLLRADAGKLPLTAQSIDVLLSDLPYGHTIGNHQDNRSLYPAILSEAARLASPGARFAACTQDMRLFEASITSDWHLEKQLRVHQRRAIPAIYLLRRTLT
ncbi:RNA methyltransferase [Microlunatus endophyticus]|uniref:RNA methyltransferase n=1 Tax=Microlunatus endophyticus TaxID=1716077 RepID=A0A917W944_9ACTN|nr:RNA methyltransferase [Microlunatus endophyticus]